MEFLEGFKDLINNSTIANNEMNVIHSALFGGTIKDFKVLDYVMDSFKDDMLRDHTLIHINGDIERIVDTPTVLVNFNETVTHCCCQEIKESIINKGDRSTHITKYKRGMTIQQFIEGFYKKIYLAIIETRETKQTQYGIETILRFRIYNKF